MTVIFFSRQFAWPLRTGASVHAGNMMKSLARLGRRILLVTEGDLNPEAQSWLQGVTTIRLQPELYSGEGLVGFGALEKKGIGYIGASPAGIAAFRDFVRMEKPQGVVAVGMDSLPYLRDIPRDIRKAWYVADDPLLAQWSGTTRTNFRMFITQAVYQRIFKGSVDGTWLVSDRDAWWNRWISGGSNPIVIPNGVDLGAFSTAKSKENRIDKSCCFWGNLGFPPNRDALNFFLSGPWKKVVAEIPDAEFWIAGSEISEELRSSLAKASGVRYLGEVSDIRESFSNIPIAVFPFQTGAGIKNKVLEAAAMSKSVLLSKRASNGLRGNWGNAMQLVVNESDWAESLMKRMRNSENTEIEGRDARAWVESNHSWDSSARIADHFLAYGSASKRK